jgi:hypothetical protein
VKVLSSNSRTAIKKKERKKEGRKENNTPNAGEDVGKKEPLIHYR